VPKEGDDDPGEVTSPLQLIGLPLGTLREEFAVPASGHVVLGTKEAGQIWILYNAGTWPIVLFDGGEGGDPHKEDGGYIGTLAPHMVTVFQLSEHNDVRILASVDTERPR